MHAVRTSCLRAQNEDKQRETMNPDDAEILSRLVSYYGLPEIVSTLGRLCSDQALRFAPYHAHVAKKWMETSADLDDINVKIERRQL
jgi:hypothetical protein